MRVQEDRRPVEVIGAGLDLGAGRRGVDMGPSAIPYAGLEARIEGLGRRCEAWGNVEAAVAEASAVGDARVRFLSQIKETCGRVARLVAKAVDQGFVLLVLGGDHSVAVGTLGGLASGAGAGGVLWLDAHADLNRPGDLAERKCPRDAACGRPSVWPDPRSRAPTTGCRRWIRRVSRSSGSARSTRPRGRCLRNSTCSSTR